MALEDDLKVYWKMDESTGTRQDSTANNHDLSDNNTVLADTGKINQAAKFISANSEYLSMASHADVVLGPGKNWTIALWFSVDGGESPLISKRAANGLRSDAANEYLLIASPFREGVTFYGGAGADNVISSSGQLSNISSPSKFSFVCITWSQSPKEARLYSGPTKPDYSLAQRKHFWSVDMNAGTTDLRIGSNNGSQLFHQGEIDEVGLWQRALTEAEVNQLWNGGAGQSHDFGASAGFELGWATQPPDPVWPPVRLVPHPQTYLQMAGLVDGVPGDPPLETPKVSQWASQAPAPIFPVPFPEHLYIAGTYEISQYITPPTVDSWWRNTDNPVIDQRIGILQNPELSMDPSTMKPNVPTESIPPDPYIPNRVESADAYRERPDDAR